MLSYEYYEIFMTITYFEEQLQTTASEYFKVIATALENIEIKRGCGNKISCNLHFPFNFLP